MDFFAMIASNIWSWEHNQVEQNPGYNMFPKVSDHHRREDCIVSVALLSELQILPLTYIVRCKIATSSSCKIASVPIRLLSVSTRWQNSRDYPRFIINVILTIENRRKKKRLMIVSHRWWPLNSDHVEPTVTAVAIGYDIKMQHSPRKFEGRTASAQGHNNVDRGWSGPPKAI